MKKLFFALIFAALPVLSFAAEHGGPELEKSTSTFPTRLPCRMVRVPSPTIAWGATAPSSSVTSVLPMTSVFRMK